MATATQTDQARMNGQAVIARSEAVKTLIAAHADEFGELLVAERTARGLPAEAGGESTKELLSRLEKAEEKAAKARADLAARGVKVPEASSDAKAEKAS